MEKRKLSRRDFLNLSVMTAAGAALAACAPTATPEGPSEEMPKEEVVVSFWSDLVGSKEEGRAALIAAYNAANLGRVRIDHEGTFGGGEMQQKFLTAVSGGVVPDLLANGDEYIPGYVDIEALTDLGPYLEASDAISADDFPEGVLELCKYDGKIWALPLFAETLMMYYNKDLMVEAGLDPESPPQDWDSLLAMAQAIVKRDANGNLEVAGCEINGWSAPLLFLPMIDSWGGSLLNADMSKATFNGPEGKEFLQLLVDFLVKHKVDDLGWGTEFEDSPDEPFVAGKSGSMFDIPAAAKRIDRWRPSFQNWSMTKIPAGPGGFRQVAQTMGLMIPKLAEHKDEAWAFMEYWMQPKVELRFAMDIFRPPSTWAALEDEQLLNNPRVAPVSEALKNTVTRPITIHWAEIYNTLSAEIELALVGDKTAAQALDDAAATVDQILATG
jgi:ABC-type glycerol-3-phosphate transport system substrate-binding protein